VHRGEYLVYARVGYDVTVAVTRYAIYAEVFGCVLYGVNVIKVNDANKWVIALYVQVVVALLYGIEICDVTVHNSLSISNY